MILSMHLLLFELVAEKFRFPPSVSIRLVQVRLRSLKSAFAVDQLFLCSSSARPLSAPDLRTHRERTLAAIHIVHDELLASASNRTSLLASNGIVSQPWIGFLRSNLAVSSPLREKSRNRNAHSIFKKGSDPACRTEPSGCSVEQASPYLSSNAIRLRLEIGLRKPAGNPVLGELSINAGKERVSLRHPPRKVLPKCSSWDQGLDFCRSSRPMKITPLFDAQFY